MSNNRQTETKPFSACEQILVLFFTDARRKHLAYQEVTLSCDNLIKDQKDCIYTTWLFSNSSLSSSIELFNLGKIKSHKPDRLSLTKNCSLTIKNLRGEDAGRYTCRQFNSTGAHIEPDTNVELSVDTSEYYHHLFSSPPLNHDDHFNDEVYVTAVALSRVDSVLFCFVLFCSVLKPPPLLRQQPFQEPPQLHQQPIIFVRGTVTTQH